MKLTILLAILATSAVICDVNLITFGDNGQVEAFKKTLCGADGKQMKDPKDFYEKYFAKEKAEEKTEVGTDGKCKLNGKVISGDEGMKNFQNVLCNVKVAEYIQASNTGVILGDMVYPESKGLVLKSVDEFKGKK